MKVSVLATSFNNEKHIASFARRTASAVADITSDFEIVIVDDGSTDRSWEMIKELSAEIPQVNGIKLSRNFGQHPSILAGLDEVRGDMIVLMDSDLDDEPEFIPQLLRPMTDNEADIVLTTQPNPKRYRITSRAFHAMIQRSTRSLNVPNIGTFRAFNRKVLEALRQYRDHSAVYGPLSTQIGFRQTYVELRDDGSVRNPSNYNFRRRLRLSLPLLINEVSVLLKLVLGLAVVTLLLVVGIGITALVRYIGGGGSIVSTTSLVFIVIVLNQALMGLAVGALAVYARVTLKEALRRPRYHIAARSAESKE
jgi:dolichol-phosphate mannosyltransferase